MLIPGLLLLLLLYITGRVMTADEAAIEASAATAADSSSASAIASCGLRLVIRVLRLKRS